MTIQVIRKTLSVLTVYALFLQELVPFTHAMNHLASLPATANARYNHQPAHEARTVSAPQAGKSKPDLLAEMMPPKRAEQFSVTQTASGPGQAETSGFSIGSTDGMVNKFTGDFSYSIPLMDVEGYPIVLQYNSNVGMNSEASWVGLGWDLSVGSISREMRGIPDEFNGTDDIVREIYQKPNIVSGAKTGVFAGAGIEIKNWFIPSVQVTALWGAYSSSYLGIGTTLDFGLQAKLSLVADGDKKNLEVTPSFGLGYSRDSKNGIGINSTLGISGGFGPSEGKTGLSGGLGTTFGKSFNSRAGLTAQSFGLNLYTGFLTSGKKMLTNYSMAYSSSSVMPYGTLTSVPRLRLNNSSDSYSSNFSLYTGVEKMGKHDKKITAKAGMIIQDYGSEVVIFDDLTNTTIHQPAYGYLHSSKRKSDDDQDYPVMDYERFNDFQYSEEMSNLPFSAQTPDVFYVNALGIGGSFRAFRTDFGTYYDPTTVNTHNAAGKLFSDDINDISAGVTTNEITPSEITYSLGYSNGIQPARVESGNWTQNDENLIDFEEQQAGTDFDATTYFKAMGEMTPTDMDAYNYMGGAPAENFNVVAVSGEIAWESKLKQSNSLISKTTLNAKASRPIIATRFKPYTAEELMNASNTYYRSYADNMIYSTISRLSSNKKAHHVSAIEVTSTDGIHYMYGIPVYNYKNDEISFACGSNDGSAGFTSMEGHNDAEGTVYYKQGVDNSTGNDRGRSNFYDKTTMPAYAHSFLLSEITSSDYIDVSGDGPTPDDVGSYHKFNHYRLYCESDPYKWRFPISGGPGDQSSEYGKALWQRGFISTSLDDVANYSYGEKEIWYTRSVESKNYIAIFRLEDRLDGHGVQDDKGYITTSKPLKRLHKIELYSLSEYNADPANAKPIQTVEFEYDNSLCLNDPSNSNTYGGDPLQSGKLTLKSIRVYSGSSVEGGLSSYEFTYSDENPSFTYGATDAWGNYKPKSASLPNDQYPYAPQDETFANDNSQAWKLTGIHFPAGGEMLVNYEADRYGYVQGERSMRYFNIVGLTDIFRFLHLQQQSSWDQSSMMDNTLMNTSYDLAWLNSFLFNNGYTSSAFLASKLESGGTNYGYRYGKVKEKMLPNHIVIFRLDEPLSGNKADVDNEVKERYFKDVNTASSLMLKVKYSVQKEEVTEIATMQLDVAPDLSDAFGAMTSLPDDVKSIGVMPPDANGDYQYGYVVLKPTNTANKEKKGKDKTEGIMMNPIQRFTLDYSRQNLPELVYGSCEACSTDLSVDRHTFMGHDMYKFMARNAEYSSDLVLANSFVRLYEPDNEKFGGNGRVKSITYKDNWDVISGEFGSTYQWDYSYATAENEYGVAAFEPRGALDECPLYHWDTYVNINRRFPDETRFTPTPIAQFFYPRASVGYESTKVQFNNGLDYGYSLSSYHTVREADARVSFQKTPIDKSTKVSRLNKLTGNSVDLMGYSQGFSVITNDYHGKPIKSGIYNNNGDIVVETAYEYYKPGETIQMLDRSGILSAETVASSYDMHADTRFITFDNSTRVIGLRAFVKSGTVPVFGVAPIFHKSQREQGFYSTTFVKHLNNPVIVKSIRTTNMNSENTAENKVYDKYTGNVILSSLKDEFDDELYSMAYPAHWAYPGMREVSFTDYPGLTGSLSANTFTVSLPSGIILTDFFCAGDVFEANLSGNPTLTKVYALKVTENTLTLIEVNGSAFQPGAGTYELNLVESNRKNRLNEHIQSVVTKKKIPLTPGAFNFPHEEIISASVLTYRDRMSVRCYSEWPGDKDPPLQQVPAGEDVNPFFIGAMGDPVPDGQYIWQDERIDYGDTGDHPHGIRFNGTYETYIPYYDQNGTSGRWFPIDHASYPSYPIAAGDNKWRKLGQIRHFNEFGTPIESIDQIGISSAALFGYNRDLKLIPVAQAVNARQQDIAFDGFEDYNYQAYTLISSPDSHFDFHTAIQAGVSISPDVRHSGLSSLKVENGNAAYVEKSITNPCTTREIPEVGASFNAGECVCVPPFDPSEGTYVIGAWIKQTTGAAIVVKINYLDGTPQTSTATFLPEGPVIDGWQRVEGTFDIPANATSIRVTLSNGGNEDVYFDDLRIHPFLAAMTTVVYDPATLLPMATHDAYNFTTFYNYDENLSQVRVRVETIEGIKTIIETEASGQKTFKN